MIAAQKRHEGIVKLLLEYGASLDPRDSSGRTALAIAAEKGHEGIVKLLLDRGACLGPRDSRGRTALAIAAIVGSKAIVELLLRYPAYPDYPGGIPLEALRGAAEHAADAGKEAIAELLHAKARSHVTSTDA